MDPAGASLAPVCVSLAASFLCIGHVPSLQQSQSSQHDAFASAVAEASFFFIGHESPLQQPHARATIEPAPVPYATANIASPSTSRAAIIIVVFLFIFNLVSRYKRSLPFRPLRAKIKFHDK